MASNTLSPGYVGESRRDALARGAFEGAVQAALAPLASLRVTVVLFALAIFIILVGTLAQVEKDMWEVIDDYFRAWVAWIDFQVLLPRPWFPKWQDVRGGFWFPGGGSIGLALAVNLLAAHLVRFKIQARGSRLAAGLIVTAIGVVFTTLVIVGGHNREGLQGQPPFAWTTLWLIVKLVLAGTSVGLACTWGVLALRRGADERRVERRLVAALAVTLGAVAVHLAIAGPRAYLGDAGMRILWQLIQSGVAALVLLAGCNLIFRNRGGMVLIHAGLALMMFGQFYVAKYDSEEQMIIEEGQTARSAQDIRQTELAIVDSSDPQAEEISVIPQPLLRASERGQGPALWNLVSRRAWPLNEKGEIDHRDLPFKVKVERYYENARLVDAKAGEKNPATAGTGLHYLAAPVRSGSGTETDSGVDLAAAYVKFRSKDGSADLGTYLVSQIASTQNVSERLSVGGKTYEVSLRFKQNYKPYSITLVDVRKDDYLGTTMPRNYSSDVRLVDPERNIDREIHIWMNNPLRYAGETFYQSSYSGPPKYPVETTTLQVVRNSGWMIPYVSCVLVSVGMLSHFSSTLLRFLRHRMIEKGLARWSFSGDGILTPLWQLVRRRRRTPGESPARPAARPQGKGADKTAADLPRPPASLLFQAVGGACLALLLIMLAGWALRAFVPPRTPAGQMQIHEFGRLPMVADGRVKPFDTLARNTLRVLANRETFTDAAGKKQPAIRWLLDVIADPQQADRNRVFRIVNLEVLDTLGLKRRKGNLYSVSEIRRGLDAFEKQAAKAREKHASQLSVYERKLLELEQQIHAFSKITAAFQLPDLPPLPSSEDKPETSRQKLQAFRAAYENFVRSLDATRPPLAVPLADRKTAGKADWESYARAWADSFAAASLTGSKPEPAVLYLSEMFLAYGEKNAAAFNKSLADYASYLRKVNLPQLKGGDSFTGRAVAGVFGSFYRFEAYFNHVAPFYVCSALYVTAFVLAALAWLGWSGPLNRSAYVLLGVTFAIHTLALAARVYISGRPPVTNLYSSAVFIGWGVAGLALVFEWIYRNGIGNAAAGVLGFASLLVAYNLAGDGDTFTVLQAVLDTQFWLATHVVSITLGYSTTFLAGGLGVLYVLRGLFTPTLNGAASKELTRMIYGTLCFSVFFSFVGTVLGGLWADDSWGRFWGWDPKENGALIIVLWNALVLHAAWGGLVRDRGLAVLSVGGNIVTSWSWFGVNELNVGLHSYGFTEGVLLVLGLFVGSQLLVCLFGCLPKSVWWSFRVQRASAVPGKVLS